MTTIPAPATLPPMLDLVRGRLQDAPGGPVIVLEMTDDAGSSFVVSIDARQAHHLSDLLLSNSARARRPPTVATL